jgi:hypothetical protein
MDYPKGFPEHLKQPIEAAISEAEIEFVKQRKASGKIWGHDEIELLIKRYIRKVMFAFSDSACRAVEEGIWTGENFRKGFARYLHEVTEYVWTKKHPWPHHASKMMDLRLAALTQIEESKEWIKIQERLKEAAQPKQSETPRPYSMATAIQQATQTQLPIHSIETAIKGKRQLNEPHPELLEGKDKVSRKTAAKALGIAERTLDRWIKAEKVTTFGVGHRKQFKAKELLRILNRKNSDKVDISGQ